MVTYPILVAEMAKREIKKKNLCETLGITQKGLWKKLNGKAPFTWPEVRTIWKEFFPDIPPDILFEEAKK